MRVARRAVDVGLVPSNHESRSTTDDEMIWPAKDTSELRDPAVNDEMQVRRGRPRTKTQHRREDRTRSMHASRALAGSSQGLLQEHLHELQKSRAAERAIHGVLLVLGSMQPPNLDWQSGIR